MREAEVDQQLRVSHHRGCGECVLYQRIPIADLFPGRAMVALLGIGRRGEHRRGLFTHISLATMAGSVASPQPSRCLPNAQLSGPNIGIGIIMPATNPLEWLNPRVKRRADVVGLLSNEDAIIRLIGAVILAQNDGWQSQHRA